MKAYIKNIKSKYRNIKISRQNREKINEDEHKSEGFTLIEMVIVVTIIGILSSIVALKYSGAQKIARENADYANASVIATAAYLSKENGDDEGIYTSTEKLKRINILIEYQKFKANKGKNLVLKQEMMT